MSNTIFELTYLVMPDYIYRDSRLSDIARRTYCFIHSYNNPFFFSNDHLSEMFDCHPDTISTAVKQLEELGLITIQYRNKAGGGKARLCVDAVSKSVLTPTWGEESEAANRSKHPDKVKDNKKKEKFFDGTITNMKINGKAVGEQDSGGDENPGIVNLRRKKERQTKKGAFPKQRGYSAPTPRPDYEEQKKKRLRGTDLSHLV